MAYLLSYDHSVKDLSCRFDGLFLVRLYCIVFCVLSLLPRAYSFEGQVLDHGAYNEFKVEIAGGYEECFYQYIPEGATCHIGIEVLRGQDELVDFSVMDQTKTTLHREVSIKRGTYSQEHAVEGTYSICIDNVYSRFGSKIVTFYIAAFYRAGFDAYMDELNEIHKLASNFSGTLDSVERSTREMLFQQARSRLRLVHDFYLAKGNNYYVSAWSLLQCVTIVICSVVQVYLLRRLFRTTNVTPTMKPRA